MANVADQAQAREETWWCNFCQFSTRDLNEYLSHSCVDVLAANGQFPASGGETHCR
ncbi:MAG: hypothetical protein ACREM8_02710 [Vulcanimicrobiaceae bacterium]